MVLLMLLCIYVVANKEDLVVGSFRRYSTYIERSVCDPAMRGDRMSGIPTLTDDGHRAGHWLCCN